MATALPHATSVAVYPALFSYTTYVRFTFLIYPKHFHPIKRFSFLRLPQLEAFRSRFVFVSSSTFLHSLNARRGPPYEPAITGLPEKTRTSRPASAPCGILLVTGFVRAGVNRIITVLSLTPFLPIFLLFFSRWSYLSYFQTSVFSFLTSSLLWRSPGGGIRKESKSSFERSKHKNSFWKVKNHERNILKKCVFFVCSFFSAVREGKTRERAQ